VYADKERRKYIMKKEIFRGEVYLVDFGKPFSERDSRQA